MASNSSSCPTPGGGHLNGYPVPPYAFFFPHMLGGLSPPSTLAGIQHQLPVSGYSTPSPASEYRGTVGGVVGPLVLGLGCVGTPLCQGLSPVWDTGATPRLLFRHWSVNGPRAVAPVRVGVSLLPATSSPPVGTLVWGASAPCPVGSERWVLLPMCPH